jgi:hypothetical protein
MALLDLLAACLEQGRNSIALTLADGIERDHFERLHQIGAMAQTRAEVVICPCCQSHAVRIMVVGSGFCIDCGQVKLGLQDMQRLSPDGDWLRRRIAQALDLAGGSARETVPDRVWRIGDVGRSSNRHRVLFGQQLGDMRVLRALLTLWPTHVGGGPVILITTSRIDRVFLPGVPVQIVPLSTAFHLRGSGLVADEAIWAGIQTARRSTTAHGRVGPFAPNYRDILLPGESVPVALTHAQSALLRILWEQQGVPIHRENLIARARLDLDKPVQAFPRPKYPDANRAYRFFVRSNRQGQYWWASEIERQNGFSSTDSDESSVDGG